MAHAASGNKSSLWGAVGPTISKFQWLAVLEVVHAALGMVRSPVATTFMQVLHTWQRWYPVSLCCILF